MPPEEATAALSPESVAAVVRVAIAAAHEVSLGAHAPRRRVLPPTFYGAHQDTDNASEYVCFDREGCSVNAEVFQGRSIAVVVMIRRLSCGKKHV